MKYIMWHPGELSNPRTGYIGQAYVFNTKQEAIDCAATHASVNRLSVILEASIVGEVTTLFAIKPYEDKDESK